MGDTVGDIALNQLQNFGESKRYILHFKSQKSMS